VNYLQDLFGSSALVTNAGVSGTTMLKKGLSNDLTPASYWNTSAWQSALASTPDIVTIMLGTNDAKYFNWEGIQQSYGDYYSLDYVDMINKLRALPTNPKIYVLVPPPLYEPYPFDMNQTIINTIYPVLVRDIGDVTDTEVIDIYSAFTSPSLVCDGCHPTPEGSQLIASTIYNVIGKTN
jgi:acyl-CoA thioesterase-1